MHRRTNLLNWPVFVPLGSLLRRARRTVQSRTPWMDMTGIIVWRFPPTYTYLFGLRAPLQDGGSGFLRGALRSLDSEACDS